MLLTQVPSYFKSRRDRLTQAHSDSVFIFPAAPELIRNHDVTHAYRQDSSFYYLTGFDEPESVLVLAPEKSILFVRARDVEKEIWDGERYGVEGAIKVFGVDEAYLIQDLEKKLPELLTTFLKKTEKIYYRLGKNTDTSNHLDGLVLRSLEASRRTAGRTGKGLPPIYDPTEVLGEMRIIKTPEEIEFIRKAASVTAQAHRSIVSWHKPGMKESEVAARIDYEFRSRGCQRLAFDTILAAGKNATCLHYRSNNDLLREGQLVLVDAGGELDYYAGDITRTLPVGRKFTAIQALAYDVVLKAQEAGLALCKPGVRLAEVHRRVTEVMIEGLMALGLLHGKVHELIASGAHRRFFPHSTSHWMGLDVHDFGLYFEAGESRVLRPGMVFSVEPGLYIQPNDHAAPSEYRGMGIRIEDDVLITETGCEILTHEAPKTRAEIESLREQALRS